MKESISYSFLLNIVLLFIFTSFAIVMGVLSYYKAFKANTIITETIEKYEGYNCVSAEEIARKLGNIGYNTPFNVTCTGKDNNGTCMVDENQNYAVISYNLDMPTAPILRYNKMVGAYEDEEKYSQMNSRVLCNPGTGECTTNKHYQYGVYTYMYVDMPAISHLLRIPFFSKTDIMYEFRNFYINYDNSRGTTVAKITEVESIFDNLYTRTKRDGKTYIKDAYIGTPVITDYDAEDNPITTTNISASDILSNTIFESYSEIATGGNSSYEYLFGHITNEAGINYRTRTMIELLKGENNGLLDTTLSGSIKGYGKDGYIRRACGYVLDYSKVNAQ